MASSPATTSRTSASIGYDVVVNKPKIAAYRAPARPSPRSPSRASSTSWRGSSASTRSSSASRTPPRKATRRPTGRSIRASACRDAGGGARSIRTTKAPLRQEPGAAAWPRGFWFNIGGKTSSARSASTPTARSRWSKARPTSAARAPRIAMQLAEDARHRLRGRARHRRRHRLASATPTSPAAAA